MTSRHRSKLTIALETTHPVALRAAAELAAAWRRIDGARVGVGLAGGVREGPTVRLGLGSLVRPSVLVAFDQAYEPAAASFADTLALSLAAWDGLGEREPWRELSAPMDALPHLGQPSASCPWVVTLPGGEGAGPSLEGSPQLHIIGGLRPPARGAVWWPRLSRVAAAVLGRATIVLGRENPLIYDALRAGVPVQDEASEVPAGALAGLVPPSLLGDERLWIHVADTAREAHASGASPEPLMTPAWVARGRDRIRAHRAAPPSTLELLRRRYHKLQRDPRRFFSDSRHGALRAVGRAAFRSNG